MIFFVFIKNIFVAGQEGGGAYCHIVYVQVN